MWLFIATCALVRNTAYNSYSLILQMPLPSNIDVLDDSGAFTPELVYKPNPTFPIREDKKRGILFSNFFFMYREK